MLLLFSSYLLLSFVVLALYYFIVKGPKNVVLLMLVLVPVVMTIHWMEYEMVVKPTWFMYLKFYSVFAAVIFFQWSRFKEYNTLFKRIIWIFLALNILEAIMTDFLDGYVVNALAGVLLVASQPAAATIRISEEDNRLLYATPWSWVIAYTIWNFGFIYSAPSSHSLVLTFIHLGLPLLICWKNPALYLEGRAYMLAFSLLFYLLPITHPFLKLNVSVFNDLVVTILSWLALLAASVALYVRFLGKRETLA